jgi:hypothetical protein
MAYTSHIGAESLKGGRGSGGGSSNSPASSYGRVVHIILSSEDKYCDNLSMVNGIYYRDISKGIDETDIRELPFAFAGNSSIKTMPLIGEIVELQNLPGPSTLGTPAATTKYWIKTVNVWNHPHHNAAPDTFQENWRGSLLGDFEEQKNISPILSNQGDVIIEGRLAQTIRLGGGKGPAGNIIDSSETQSPVLLISNGQVKTSSGSELVQEDINEDFNSLYFLSNHKAAIKEANSKRDTYNTVPTALDQYKGNQVILNGGRLVFNAKEDSVLFAAKESVGLTAKTVNLDANEYFCVDAKKIYLGKAARTATSSVQQPAVLGKQLENWLGALLDALDSVATAMQTASAVGAGPVAQLNAAGPVLKATVSSLKSQYKIFQSKKVFTE